MLHWTTKMIGVSVLASTATAQVATEISGVNLTKLV